MNRFLFLMYFFCGAMIATEVTQYKAKYQFDSEEISISGIREFKKNNDGYELKFRASNIVASMFFISEFDNNFKRIHGVTFKEFVDKL